MSATFNHEWLYFCHGTAKRNSLRIYVRIIKKIAFPLKLRDPKKLYLTTLHTEELNHWAMFKFLGQPQKKPSYLLQAGDLIQCAAGNSLSQFKTQSSL